jgi:O-antigen/teichoic acid export membrane protein
MNVFQNILKLSVGDFFAKTLNFLAFVYLARVLGVSTYGVLEFALSIMTYFLLLADGGLELWATRGVAQATDVRYLAVRVLPLRIILATGAFGVLMLLLPLFPDYPNLKTIFIFFGLILFVQALNLKWVFMGQGKMTKVAIGLVVGQIIFFVALLGWVEGPSEILWVPLIRLGSDGIMMCYFGYLFSKTFNGLPWSFTLEGTPEMLKPVLTMGASHGLAQVSYNFDFVLIGFLLGAAHVGLYSAAYKPITVALALPVSYFLGLFPMLAQAFIQSRETFNSIVNRSVRLTSIVALPIGFLGIFLAEHVVLLLFGQAYGKAAPVLQVLAWSATLVILRGTFRQALNAAGKANLDLRCATASTVVNIALNILFIPRYGIIGAAYATVISEVVWIFMSVAYLNRYVVSVKILSAIFRPLIASIIMVSCFLITPQLHWIAQAGLASLVYFLVLIVLGDTEVKSWFQSGRFDHA